MFLLDTNILVYAWDERDPRKGQIGRDLIRLALTGEGMIAPHILGEYSAVMLHKMKPPASAANVLAALDALSAIRVAPAGVDVVRRAVEAQGAYGIHFYDGMMVASAERGGCDRIYSEDLSHGQRYFGVEVVNPFL